MKINKDYNFGLEVKKEICLYYLKQLENNINIDFLFSGFLNSVSEFSINENSFYLEFISQNMDIIKLFKTRFKDKIQILKSNKKSLKYNNTKFKLIIDVEKLSSFVNKFFTNYKNFIFNSDQEKKQFLTGIFLSSGSVCNPVKNSYHLEFRISNSSLIEPLEKILKKFKISFSKIFHHNKNVIYIKKSDYISDLLKIFNANQNMYILEDFRIEKDFINSLQRINNLELSNLKKQIKSNQEIINIINFLKNTNEYNKLNDNIKIYCDLKVKFPDYSLNNLVDKMNSILDKPITKSWLNHTNIKLKNIFKKFK